MSAPSSALQVRSSSRWSRLTWLLPVAALLIVFAWYATHATPLPEPGSPVEATTPADAPVYVGMMGPGERTLTLREVGVQVTGGDARAQICRGGSLGITTEADTFCSDLEDAAGATLEPGDQLVLQVVGSSGATVTTEPLRVSYREGLQFGEGETGRAVEVTVLE